VIIKKNDKNFYAVIMAGGAGTRLWPLSRQKMPKQFHKLTSQRTMIQETYHRLVNIVPKNNIFISTTEHYKKIIKQQFPFIRNTQLIIEPLPRNTAPAIGLTAGYIQKINPRAIMATIASDHIIKNISEFNLSLKIGLETVSNNEDKLATIGINPTYPDTGLGYIQKGKIFCRIKKKKVFHAKNFKEKPSSETAKKYLKSGDYFWNAGYFIFSAGNLLEIYKEFIPDTYKRICEIISWQKKSGKMNNKRKAIKKIFSSIQEEPFDTAIAEKLNPSQRLVIPSKLIWSDVGNWAALSDFFQKDNNKIPDHIKGNYINFQSKNCFIKSNRKLIATIGLENIIVIDTDDVILIARKDKVQDVKKVIKELKKRGKSGQMLI